jgi:anti-anti-sigma factor
MLTVEITTRDTGVMVIRPKGRIDTDTYTILDDKVKPLLVPPAKKFILDMEYVYYISSVGLGVIFAIKKFCEHSGGELLMTNLQPQIKKIFAVLRMLPSKAVFENMQEIDRYFDSLQAGEA